MKLLFCCISQAAFLATAGLADSFPKPLALDSGWQLQSAAQTAATGGDIAQAGFQPAGWYAATVPGTVLTTLVNNKVYPEPLYGENNRPDKIPESLCRTSYWYRTVFTVPADLRREKSLAEL